MFLFVITKLFFFFKYLLVRYQIIEQINIRYFRNFRGGYYQLYTYYKGIVNQ